MKAISASPVKAIQVGTILDCADNSGARKLKVIGVLRYKGRKRRHPCAGVADVVICSVIEGSPDIRKKKVKAIIIRQKKEYRRKDGTRICFEDNAAIVVNDNFDPIASKIKGPVAREVIERFPSVGRRASMVV
jgi:large subunit ribosomal protein L14